MRSRILTTMLTAAVLSAGSTEAIVRIKDIAQIDGVRDNQLAGYGLVVGLAGTGDRQQSRFTVQSIVNMLQEMGVNLSDREVQRLQVRNAAAVMVTANVPAWAHPGARIDALVSSLGDARDIQGGTLVLTQMKGVDGRVYGLAQGPISIGGYNLETTGGTMIRKNHPTAGVIPGGVLVEGEIPATFVQNNQINVVLDVADFGTANLLTEAIDNNWQTGTAAPVDAGMIRVNLPANYDPVIFISELEALEVDNPPVRARVVINERTGTVVVGGNVRMSDVAVAHGALYVEIAQQQLVPEPAPFAPAPPAVTQEEAQVRTESTQLVALPATETVAALAQALNSLGVTPRDIIAIFQAIKRAGALPAELVIM